MTGGLYLHSGYFECDCPPLWNGFTCNTFDNHFPGGIGRPVTPAPTTPIPLDEQRLLCIQNRCNEKAGNGRCDVSAGKKTTQSFGSFRVSGKFDFGSCLA